VQVAIIGKPNAGKSTLLNTLLNENRAIVSDIAGTTRDTIEEVLNIEGVLFRLIDTAGIREHSHDVIERLGIEKSQEKMRAASLVLYLFDVNDTKPIALQQVVAAFENENIRYLLIGNKFDREDPAIRKTFALFRNTIFISAKTKAHIDELKKALVAAAVTGDIQGESTIVTNARHYEALQKLSQALADVQRGLHDKLPGDLLPALDIQQCLHYLRAPSPARSRMRISWILFFRSFVLGSSHAFVKTFATFHDETNAKSSDFTLKFGSTKMNLISSQTN
jgi:tRNA modification GTPase